MAVYTPKVLIFRVMRYGILVLFVLPFLGLKEEQPTPQKPDGPFVLVTGFGRGIDKISFAKVKELNAVGKIFATPSAFVYAEKTFGKAPLKIASAQEFIPKAKQAFLLLSADELIPQLLEVIVTDGLVYSAAHSALRKDSITKLSITGVSALTRSIGILMEEKGYATITTKLKPHFQESDLVHISNEVSLKDSCVFSHRGRVFCSKAEHFKALLELKCNVVELTGNHNKDFGEKTFIETLNWYKANGIKTFGGGMNAADANQPLVIELKDGTRLGFIGFNEHCPLNECAKATVAGANAWNREKARTVLKRMKTELGVDVAIASVQFGEWDFYHPQKSQRAIARDLIEFGADMVYGAHAHQIQQVEFYKGKPIFFGLGNFLFDEIQRIGVRQGMFINVVIAKGKILQTQPVYTFMGDDRVNGIADSLQAVVIRKSILVDSLLYR